MWSARSLACLLSAVSAVSAVSAASAAASAAPAVADPALKASLQALMDELAAATGFALQLGFVDGNGDEYGLAAGAKPGGANVTATDTFMFGSGVKPTTAAIAVHLEETGKLSLNDKAAQYADPVLKAMNVGPLASPRLASLVALMGPRGADITVGQLVRMEGGMQDFDIPTCDDPDLVNGGKGIVQTPMTTLACLANIYGTDDMFACKGGPGSCTSYSSTNFMLAGLVLTGASVPAAKVAAAGADAWTLLDQSVIVPAAAKAAGKFDHFSYLDTGPLSDHVTVAGTTRDPSNPGSSLLVGPTQDASILGWTTSNMVAPALEVARWYNALLVEGTVVSAASLAKMTNFTPLDEGWARGTIQYGTGLMIQAVGACTDPPTLDQPGTYLGHGGDAYGALSENGHFRDLNVTISAVVNSDLDLSFAHNTFACKVYELIHKAKLGKDIDLKCRDAPAAGAKYVCKSVFGKYKQCVASDSGIECFSDCLVSCV